MPVVIKELVITATIDANLTQGNGQTALTAEQAQQLVQACVEQVLAVLRERNER